MDKSYRIHTNISSDTFLNVNMQQDFDFLEVLSLKLKQKDAYRIHSSNYGVIIGRVLANDAFGVPNAKISVFIERDDSDTSDMETLYPYKEVTTKDKDGRRYNILPDYSDDECYRVVGTFPNKRLMLDDDIQLEVYDKYWKYTTVTNNAGDYMLFGVPTGSVTVHIEMDLSDIGILSQKPRDFEYKGYNLTLFDSPSQFKHSTNLDDLAQIFSQNKSIFVYPFWGDADNGVACITRSDVQIQYKFEPTCVFMGSIVTDNDGNAIGHHCAPDIDSGINSQLVGGSGTIEMIRKTTDGLVEEYQIQGNQLIDENGVWCYQIPMNLDYIGTDEYGNIVPTDNPNKGIPTRTQVRFRISKNESSDEGFSRHTAKYLVPMNPRFSEEKYNIVDLDSGNGGLHHKISGEIPVIPEKGSDIEKMYTFGSATPISCFRDLYWNNVYSVKNYIPKVQVAHRAHSKNYGALKGSNLADDQNQIPFNKLRIDIPFLYMVVCILYTIMVWVVTVINLIISFLHYLVYEFCFKVWKFKVCPFGVLKWLLGDLSCITMSAGSDEGNVAYYPGCSDAAMDDSDCPEDMQEEGCDKRNNNDELMDKIQRNLAQEFKIIKLDLYQDWVNGCLYMPLWHWLKRKKKTFLFFTLSGAKNDYCSDSKLYSRLKTYVTCNIKYITRSLEVRNNRDSMPDSEDRWHKNRKAQVRYKRGLIKPVENKDGLTAYYYAAVQATSDNDNDELEMARRPAYFKAVRLYATDIILLGNLDPKNIYGIPQFFKCLPSTTANVPPIATIEEIPDPNAKDEIQDDIKGVEDSGDTITTGMDWNHDGASQFPAYKTGLFMDLACTYAGTRPKSCINVERVSELGVNLDTRHKIAYHEGGTDTQYGDIDTDGFISKYELDDMENRAMFATLNHIGFVPQEYQDSIIGAGAYTSQVHDKNTNYLIPKFKYIYPVDFDGRLQLPMDLYNTNRSQFEQALFDERDEAYLTFRLGAEMSDDYEQNSELRIRHFYHVYSKTLRDMPLYNNSYYFFFGIKKGSTAIDKFNELFYAPCYQNTKMPFTLDITVQGRSYCPDVYSNEGGCERPFENDRCKNSDAKTYPYGNNRNNAYGYIRVKSDDIRTPYTYTLYDSYNDVVISESGMTLEEFVIGGDIDENRNTVLNCDGVVRYQNRPCEKLTKKDEQGNIVDVYLENQEYILEVTDSDGRRISEKVKLEVPKIVGEYTATKLGAKFYNSATTRIDYICHDDNAFYGKIEMKGFTVDGYSCMITNVKYLGYSNDIEYEDENGGKYTVTDDTKGRYVFCVTGNSKDISDKVIAYLELSVFKSNKENLVRNCLCDDNTSTDGVDDNDNPINIIRALQEAEAPVNMKIVGANKNQYFLGFEERMNETAGEVSGTSVWFFMYQPNRYSMKITQGCPDCTKPIIENSTDEIIDVLNGEPFITRLNTMPTKFMVGTVNDNDNADIASTSYFYNRTVATDPKDYHLKGWCGTHEESSYMFSRREENKTYVSNQSVWEDMFKSAKDDVSSPKMKRYILKFKFDKMFKLSEGAYFTEDSSKRFVFQATGGINPILYRSVAPMYEDYEKLRNNYVLKDGFTTTCAEYRPNIIGQNYSRPLEHDNGYAPGFVPGGPRFNHSIYNSSELLGNYFAAFTRDGSYISKTKIDGRNINIERSPSFASISPMGGLKVKGKDVIGSIGNFNLAYNKGTQTLPDDYPRTTLPYLRGLYIDRRFDFDFTILAPAVGNNFSLYTDPKRNRTWKGGRLSGWTYNGIEMSYDNDYNIISAHTHSVPSISYNNTGEDPGIEDLEYTAATFNKRLEYTYKYDCADICMTCGWQQKNIPLNSEGEYTCPKCGGHNINFYHGEIGTMAVERRTNSGFERWAISKHDKDNTNFNAGNIPQIVLPGNDTTYSLDDAITYYHKAYGDEKYDWVYEGSGAPKWGKWNTVTKGDSSFGFNKDIDGDEDKEETEMKPLFKEYYSSSIAGFDIRHLYWSLFNYDRLNRYTTGGANQQDSGFGTAAIDNEVNPFYVYHYPGLPSFVSNASTYNGDFNREDAVNGEPIYGKKAYPTKRYIDVGNLPSVSYYDYETYNCSYGMQAEINDDGTIRCETDGGEKCEISLNWLPPITLIAPNGASSEYANVTYRPYSSPCGNQPFVNCVKFTAGTASMTFKYNTFTCDGFEVYTKSPKLVQVLPYLSCHGENIDGIGFYKTSNPSPSFGTPEFGQKYGDGWRLDDAIKHITLVNGTFERKTSFHWDTMTLDVNIITPENVGLTRDYRTKYGLDVDMVQTVMFEKEDEPLKSDDDDFTNIIFNKNVVTLKGQETGDDVKVFTVLVDREYRYEDDDHLVKHLRTIETSDLFDCRDIFMKILVEPPTTGYETDKVDSLGKYTDGTYVQKRKGAANPITGVTDVNSSTGQTHDGVNTGDTIDVVTDVNAETGQTGEDTTEIFIQTLTFDMYFDLRECVPIDKRQNETFTNFDMMSYVFRFYNIYNEQYDVTPSEIRLLKKVSGEKVIAAIVRFVLKWPANMGIIADKIWTGEGMGHEIPTELYVKTPSNFVYKLTGFKIKVCCNNGGQEPGRCDDINKMKKDMKEALPDDPHRYYTHCIITPSCGCGVEPPSPGPSGIC